MGDQFQLTQAAAEKYEDHSVPALFLPLARATVARIDLPRDGHVLDVACGTGALTREIVSALPGRGRVAGADLNQTMIDVARHRMPETPHETELVAADVTKLPFADASFDLALIQQGLQFFPDKPAALAEVRRVLKTGGQLSLSCWRAISPFSLALSDALGRHIDEAAATKARAPFSFRDATVIRELLENAGFRIEKLDGVVLPRNFDDLREQVMALPIEKDLRAAGVAVTDMVISEIARDLEEFRTGTAFVVPQEAHLFFARAV